MLLIFLRLSYWQIIKSDDLTARAEDQRISKREVISPRGSILFADGSTLTSITPSFLIYAQPKVIADKNSTAEKLAEVLWSYQYAEKYQETRSLITGALELDFLDDQKKKQIKQIADEIYKKITQELFWVSLGWNVPYEIKEEIVKLNLTGVGFNQKSVRFYPEGSSSAHLLGFVSSDSYGADRGYFGIEGYYNGELRGKKGYLTQERDAHGLPILIGKFDQQEPSPGKTLLLNIDRAVQSIVEESLKKGIDKFGAKGASAIVMDPMTGDILGMASYPNYDPGHVMDFPKEYFKNPLTADLYEPGSTFKVLVMAAAINEGLVKPDTICEICNGPLEVNDYTIRTWNNKYYPNATMTDVIVHSDNTGMVFISRKLGLDKMYDYLKRFGLGTLSGIDVEDEQVATIRPKADWREIDVATASFGQGISVTVVELLKAVAAIANGGKLMEPHIVHAIKSDDGAVQIYPREISAPISSESALIVKEMMVKAVDEGEAKVFKPKGFKIAGKSGTAQIPVAGHYDPTKTIASFIGFAPADKPKFIMFVRYDQPSASIYGAETAAPTFFEIARQLFIYYGLTPDSN